MKLQKHRFVASVLPKEAMSRASYGVSADSTNILYFVHQHC